MSTLTLRNVKGTPLTNTEVDDNFSNLNTDKLEKDGSNSMTGKLTTVTSSASTASIRVVAGSADPTSPVSGDVWNNAGDFKFYTGSATRVLTTLDGAQTLTNKTLDAAIVTNGLYFEGATADAFETLLTVVDPTADRTITIPDATTTMVGTDVSQTLTNKTINLTSNTLVATSAQMLAAVTDETGTGSLVFANTPTLVTPIIAEVDATADFTVDAVGDINLDADGGDIILKDGGTEFGRLVNNSGQLRLASSSSNTAAVNFTGADVAIVGDLTVGGNDIKSSGGTTAITLNTTDVAIAGDLTVTGNDIKSSSATALTLSGADVAVAGDLTVTGNDIKSSSATALTLSGADVTVAGDLQVSGNDIKSSTGAVAISLTGVDVAIAGNLTVNGTTTTVNSTTLDVDDVNITLAKGNATNLGADGAGITVEATTATNKTFTYNNGNDSWTSSEHMNIASGKTYRVGGTQISASNLSNGTTGSGSVVLATSPTLITPNIGAATGTSLTTTGASGVLARAAATQDGIEIRGRAGGTGNWEVIMTPATLSADRTITLPDVTGTVVTTGDTGTVTNTMLAGSIANAKLANSAVTVTAGTGMSGGGSVSLGSSVTLTNAGVTSNVAGTGISVSGATGAVTITNSGVTSAVAGTGVSVSAGTGAVTFSIGQAVATGSNVQFNSLGIGTAASGTAGEIRATNEITAYYSDARLKNFHGTIDNALEKVTSLNGYYFTENELAKSLGYNNDAVQLGLSAQEVQAVFPQAVAPAPIDDQYLAVKYEKLVPVLVEAIKALKLELDEVKKNCNCNK